MTEPDLFARTVSVIALLISIITAYLTLFRRGTICMTKPTFIAFCYDWDENKPKAKVVIRSLLYSTGKRGQIIENMFITVRRGETQQTFNIWGHGEFKGLARGSGLFVGETGVTYYHHFNPPHDSDFSFLQGDYEICVYAVLIGNFGHKSTRKVYTVQLTASDSPSQDEQLWFDWAPDSRKYQTRVTHSPLKDNLKL